MADPRSKLAKELDEIERSLRKIAGEMRGTRKSLDRAQALARAGKKDSLVRRLARAALSIAKGE